GAPTPTNSSGDTEGGGEPGDDPGDIPGDDTPGGGTPMRSSRLRTSKALVPPPLLTARPSPPKVRSPQFMPKADSTVLSFRPLVPALKYQPRRMHRTASLSTWATVPPPPTQNSARFLP